MKMKRFLSALVAMALILISLPVFEQSAQAASGYYIEVDITNQYVTVYRANDHTTSGIVRQMICSTGKASTPTPRGTYTLPNKRYSDERTEWHRVNGAWAQWCTRIVGGILFHSLPVSSKTLPPTPATVAALGTPASHGCVRLRVRDAKWIALNCPVGTKVKIYRSGTTNAELHNLLLDGEFYVANESYEEFLGIANAISQGATGEDVLKIQTRLNQLGYNAGAADGVFGASTHSAVCAFQKECGLSQNGRVTEKLWNRLFAADAPAAPITAGSSGPQVLELQTALKTLKLYDGPLNGVYDSATANAVRIYQSAFGLTVDGNATVSVRNSILKKAQEIKNQFGDSDYKPVIVNTSKQLAKVNVSSSLNLRQQANTSSKVLAKLKNGNVVAVVQKGATWSQVQYGSTVGYCKNTYLKFYDESSTTLTYEEAAPESTPDPNATPTPTAEPTPTSDPNATPVPTPEPTASNVTLAVGSTGDAVANLQRALKQLKLYSGDVNGSFDQATADAVKTFQTVSGMTADAKATPAVQDAILKKAREIKNQFGDVDYNPIITTTTSTVAKVKVRSSLNLRQKANTFSKILGKLKNGNVVAVLQKGATWSQVEHNGVAGYCKNSYLVFSSSSSSSLTYEPAPTPEPTATPEPTPDPNATPTPTPDPNATPAPTPEPTASNVTLAVGSTGDAVANLQRALKQLKLYSGDVNGSFDQATADAVRLFQTVSGMTTDAKATPAVQDAILKKAREIKNQFGDVDYNPIITTTTSTVAKVKVRSSLNLRQKANTSSKILGKLKNGNVVTVLQKGATWSQVEHNGVAGYCKNSYLVFSSSSSSSLTYEPAPTPEPTAAMPAADSAEPIDSDNALEIPPAESIDTAPEAPPTEPADHDNASDAQPTDAADSDGAPEVLPTESSSPNDIHDGDPAEEADSGSSETIDSDAAPTAEPADASTPAPEQLYAVVRNDSAKLYRSADAREDNVFDLAPIGSVYDIVSIDDEWIQVRLNHQNWFILTDHVQITAVKPAATNAPTEAPTTEPTEAPTAESTVAPTEISAAESIVVPTEAPTAEPTVAPTEAPTAKPTEAVDLPLETASSAPVSTKDAEEAA